MRVVVEESRVVIETEARGLLAAAAHDLRIEAPIASGEADDARCTARFEVAAMRVAESRRHGTDAWRTPDERDARDIERRIRDEAFPGLREIVVEGQSASVTVRAARTQTVTAAVAIERGEKTVVRGRCALSLAALGVGKIHVPLGAIKLDDRVEVSFDVVLA